MQPSVLAAVRDRLDTRLPAFFRFRSIPGSSRVVLTNLEGNWLVLADDEMRAFATGQVGEGSELFTRLKERNFLRAHYDVEKARARLERRRVHLDRGVARFFVGVLPFGRRNEIVFDATTRVELLDAYVKVRRIPQQIIAITTGERTVNFGGGLPHNVRLYFAAVLRGAIGRI